jgi:hypothetical protein
MHFIDVIGFDIKEGKMAAYQEWVRQNEKELAAQLPDGAEHIGTFVSIYNSEKDSGTVFILTRMESYGTGDKIAALGANETYSRLVGEAMEFVDQSNSAGGSRMLLKAMSDATVWA